MPTVNEPKPANVKVRLSVALNEWVEKEAERIGVTVSEYLRHLVISDMKGAK